MQFRFRLEKLLDYRRKLEKQAKDTYLAARASRLQMESSIEDKAAERKVVALRAVQRLDEMAMLQACLDRMEQEEADLKALCSALQLEEEAAMEKWLAAKRESDALEKLREKDREEWLIHEMRREQAEMDEWAVTRRAA